MRPEIPVCLALTTGRKTHFGTVCGIAKWRRTWVALTQNALLMSTKIVEVIHLAKFVWICLTTEKEEKLPAILVPARYRVWNCFNAVSFRRATGAQWAQMLECRRRCRHSQKLIHQHR
jgi:hypothetical protein